MDERESALRSWADAKVGPVADWATVSGDASSRRYFRYWHAGRSLIAVDSPPLTEKNDAFLAVRAQLAQASIRVPALIAVEHEQGFMVLEDLGDTLLLGELTAASVGTYYAQSIQILAQCWRTIDSPGELPLYSDAVLSEELSRFPEWFCQALLGYSLDQTERDAWEAACSAMKACAAEQPRCFVHRDFHSRNILLPADGELALIDFQDALWGPLTYDLVSLLKDCYVQWPRQQYCGWVEEARVEALDAGVAVPDAGTFLRWVDWIGLQRHLKVLGTFARLALRDSKPAYLNDLPRVLSYIEEVLQIYPEFEALQQLFKRRLTPCIQTQDWWLSQ